MSHLKERLARAIFEAAPEELARTPFDQASSLAKRKALAQAEAALKALRAEVEPEDEYEAELARVVSRIEAATPPRPPTTSPAPRRDWTLPGALALMAAGAAGLIVAFAFRNGLGG